MSAEPHKVVTVLESSRPRAPRAFTLGDYVFGRRLASDEEEE